MKRNTIGGIMTQKKIAVLGPGSWGTALSQVLNDNGHEVRIWGNVPEQINEIIGLTNMKTRLSSYIESYKKEYSKKKIK